MCRNLFLCEQDTIFDILIYHTALEAGSDEEQRSHGSSYEFARAYEFVLPSYSHIYDFFYKVQLHFIKDITQFWWLLWDFFDKWKKAKLFLDQ